MVKKMKRFLVVFLACAIALAAFSGCGAGSANQSASGGNQTAQAEGSGASTGTMQSDTQKKISLRVMSYATDWVDLFKEINTKYQKPNPNVEIIYDAKDGSQYYTLLATQIQSGEAPDLFATHGITTSNLEELVNQDVCLPLDGLFDKSQYPEWLLDMFTYNGKIYTIPGMVEDSLGVFYNKKIFDRYGLSKPKTQEEMDVICQTLLKNGVAPLTIPGKSAFDAYMAFCVFVQSYAGDWNSNFPHNGKKFTDTEFLEAVKLFSSWADKGYFGENYRSLDLNSSIMQLIQGKAAMFMEGAWQAPNFKDSPDIEVLTLKRADGKDAGITSPKQVAGLAVFAKSENKDAAVEFAEYFASAEIQNMICSIGDSVPSSFDAAKSIASPDRLLMQFSIKDHSEMTFADSGGVIPKEGVSYMDGMMDLIQKLLYKKITPEALCTEADKLLDFSKLEK